MHLFSGRADTAQEAADDLLLLQVEELSVCPLMVKV